MPGFSYEPIDKLLILVYNVLVSDTYTKGVICHGYQIFFRNSYVDFDFRINGTTHFRGNCRECRNQRQLHPEDYRSAQEKGHRGKPPRRQRVHLKAGDGETDAPSNLSGCK